MSPTSYGAFEPHEVDWTPEKVDRFWNARAVDSTAESTYWSRANGQTFLQFVERHIPLSGNVLDYGCGPGFLMELLVDRLDQGSVAGADPSLESLRLAESRLGKDPRTHGFYALNGLSQPPREHFNLIFFIETLEHLLPHSVVPTIQQLRDLLVVGGLVVVTTPNDEDIERAKVTCPDCGAHFHYMQHMTSWNRTSLAELMTEHGFEELICEPAFFTSRYTLGDRLRMLLGRQQHLPSLVYIGKKSEGRRDQ